MIKNILRKLKTDRRTTLINLLGFAASMAVAIVLMAFVLSEKSYDRSYKHRDYIYQVVRNYHETSMVEEILNDNLTGDFPQIEASCRYAMSTGGYVYYGKDKFTGNIADVDNGFFQVFGIEILRSTVPDTLSASGGVILTESFAKDIFGDEDPLGKVVNIQDAKDFTVVAISADLPKRSSLQAHGFISYRDKWNGSHASMGGGRNRKESWFNHLFVQFKQDADITNFDTLLSANLYKKKVLPQTLDEGEVASQFYKLLPFTGIYFNTEYEGYGGLNHANIKLINLMMIVAIIIFSLSVFNYINLTTASGIERIKDIGIKKTIGASHWNIFSQILVESLLVCTAAFLLAFGVALAVKPIFVNILGKEIEILFLFSTTLKIILSIVFVVLVSLISGLYPAIATFFYTSKAAIQKNVSGLNDAVFRKTLNVLQLTVSTGLIICLIIITKQIEFAKQKDLGFKVDQLVRIDMDGVRNKMDVLTDQFAENPNILKHCYSVGAPGRIHLTMGDGDLGNVRTIPTEEKFIETFGLELIKGRNFHPTENKACIVNETLYKQAEWKNLEGKMVQGRKVVGVVKDFHFESMFEKIDLFMLMKDNFRNPSHVTLRVKQDKISETLATLEETWKELAPKYDFNYEFYDDSFAQMYEQEENYARALKIFGAIAIIISCLGMFGLAEYSTKRRIKEIGVRKVNGAKISEVLFLLNKDFIMWIIISVIIAAPFCLYFMHRWIETFAYHTEISWWIFVASGLTLIFVSLATVSYQTWRAARKNPVEALRYE